MPFTDPPTDSVTIPSDAGPADPRIVLGPEIPPELTAFYGDANITGALVYWIDGNRYGYSAVIANPGGAYRVDGVVNMLRPAGLRVCEVVSYFLNDTGAGRIFIGGFEAGAVDPANPLVEVVREASFDEDVSMWKSLAVDRDATVNGGLSVLGDMTLGGGRSMGRGLVARFGAQGNPVATATTVETAIATVPSEFYLAGRAYEVTVRAQVTPTATLDLVPKVRKGAGVAGALLVDYGRQQIQLATGGDRYYSFTGGFRTAAAAVTTPLTFTAATSAGTLPFKGFSSGGLVVEVWDVGDAAYFPDLPALT